MRGFGCILDGGKLIRRGGVILFFFKIKKGFYEDEEVFYIEIF